MPATISVINPGLRRDKLLVPGLQMKEIALVDMRSTRTGTTLNYNIPLGVPI